MWWKLKKLITAHYFILTKSLQNQFTHIQLFSNETTLLKDQEVFAKNLQNRSRFLLQEAERRKRGDEVRRSFANHYAG